MTGRRLARIGATALAIGVLVGIGTAAHAGVSPSSGPVAGGTSVTVDVPQNRFTQLSAGGHFVLGLTADGSVYAWGDNQFGQLGDGTTTSSGVPVRVAIPAGVTITQLSAGSRSALALAADGSVYAWGDNAVGELGDGTTTSSPTPVRVAFPSGTVVTSISAGDGQVPPGANLSHAVATTSSGAVYAWGTNTYGLFGNGTTTGSTVPIAVPLPGGATAAAVSTGQIFTLVLAADGTVYAAGQNAFGSLGRGTTSSTGASAFAAVSTSGMPSGVRFTAVSAGRAHALALGSDGVLYAWGLNTVGQLGDGTTTNRTLPTPVALPAGTAVASFAAGSQSSYALGSDGSYLAWGGDSTGQLGDGGAGASNPTPHAIALGLPATITRLAPSLASAHVLLADGRSHGWGQDLSGELGTGSTASTTRPSPVEALSPTVVTAVTLGGTAGTGLSVDDALAPEEATVLTPAHPAGPVDVVVQTQLRAGGAGPSVTTPAGFQYVAPPVAPRITSGPPPDGQVGVPYSYLATATGTGPITFAVTGALPPGLVFDARTGTLSGTPTDAGVYAFTITADNSAGTAALPVTLTVAAIATPAPATATPAAIPGSTTLAYTGMRPAVPLLALVLGGLLLAAGVATAVARGILRRRG